ncbi:hypothetical protein CHU98_g8366, partial [Xylaria longipes]
MADTLARITGIKAQYLTSAKHFAEANRYLDVFPLRSPATKSTMPPRRATRAHTHETDDPHQPAGMQSENDLAQERQEEAEIDPDTSQGTIAATARVNNGSETDPAALQLEHAEAIRRIGEIEAIWQNRGEAATLGNPLRDRADNSPGPQRTRDHRNSHSPRNRGHPYHLDQVRRRRDRRHDDSDGSHYSSDPSHLSQGERHRSVTPPHHRRNHDEPNASHEHEPDLSRMLKFNCPDLTMDFTYSKWTEWVDELKFIYSGARQKFRHDSQKILYALNKMDRSCKKAYQAELRGMSETQASRYRHDFKVFIEWTKTIIRQSAHLKANISMQLEKAKQKENQHPRKFDHYLASIEDQEDRKSEEERAML